MNPSFFGWLYPGVVPDGKVLSKAQMAVQVPADLVRGPTSNAGQGRAMRLLKETNIPGACRPLRLKILIGLLFCVLPDLEVNQLGQLW